MRRLALLPLALLLLAQAPPPPDGGRDGGKRKRPDPCAPHPQLYVSAMGQPFRAAAGGPDPMGQWIAQADTNGDGRVTLAEFLADADRFHAVLDRNHDGEIDPQEVSAYELEVAPEIRLYQRGAPLDTGEKHRKPKDGQADYESALGAGRFAQLNVPEPVSSADQDLDRGITRDEFRSTASRRFALLDADHAGALTAARLGHTPQQQLAIDCAVAAATGKKLKRQ